MHAALTATTVQTTSRRVLWFIDGVFAAAPAALGGERENRIVLRLGLDGVHRAWRTGRSRVLVYLRFGFIASRSPSPTKLSESRVIASMAQGKKSSHQLDW